jgi:predicted house-cleaning NTP pyrophosphatase (Maf/HAM1 superfamily)
VHAPATIKMVLPYIPALSKTNVILASASPRRAELLQQIGLHFTVKPSSFDETLPKSSFESSVGYTIETARQKALDIARQDTAADLIISADTSATKLFRRFAIHYSKSDSFYL